MNPFSPGFLSRLASSPRKVALLRASRIGDFICATPGFAALRAALPDAEIALIGLPFIKPLVDRLPALDRFIGFPGFPGIAEQFFAPRRALRFLKRMQAERFDLVVQMHGSGLYANPIALLFGGRCTAGFVRDSSRTDRLDAALPMPPPPTHEVERLLALTTFLGAPTATSAPHLFLRPPDRGAAEHLLQSLPKPLLGVHPGARDRTKRWPIERFCAVSQAANQRYGGTVVVIGGPDEAQIGEELAGGLGSFCLNLAGRLSLPILAAVIEQLSVLVSNDSGPAHMAYAMGTPSTTIFGSTDPQMWGPRKGPHLVLAHPVECRPCEYETCPIGTPCLAGIETEMVLDQIDALLDAEKEKARL